MGCTEVQYLVFELKELQAQEKLITGRTGGKTTHWMEYCKICGDSVLVNNHMEGDGFLRVEKEEKEKTKQRRRKAKPSAEQKRH